MPTLEINGAQIYYTVHGKDHPGQSPILLIHGSTSDGFTDWNQVIPNLALTHKVLVPDCRGHGRSNNPNMSYSFLELAHDAATFVQALGYEQAHIIGHSNGGNVALVMLMEHPEVVQTCVPQAANAYVTRYLIEREPKVFDPERVAHEAPEWREEIQTLTSAVNGSDYWRDLLWMTMREIISEPNYAPFELARVERPTLVIMGAQDTVNAPDEHAQYIARYIPYAELWIPDGVGHSVQLEQPAAWLAKVQDFLVRRS